MRRTLRKSNDIRGVPLDLVGGGGGEWSQALSMYFFQVNSLCMIFFNGYMTSAGFLFFEHNFRTILCI